MGHPVGLGRHSVGNVNPGAASMLAPLARTGPGLWTDARFAGHIRPAAGLEQWTRLFPDTWVAQRGAAGRTTVLNPPRPVAPHQPPPLMVINGRSGPSPSSLRAAASDRGLAVIIAPKRIPGRETNELTRHYDVVYDVRQTIGRKPGRGEGHIFSGRFWIVSLLESRLSGSVELGP